jgi:steroid delta-isomerase-like uncharacterized protein
MSTEQNKAVVRRWFDDVCNGRNAAVADEIFTPDHRHHDPSSPGVADGPEGMKRLAATYYTAFDDAHWAIDEIVATDDAVVVRWTGTGTHTRELNGLAATGRHVTVPGIFFVKMRNGKIAESYDLWDTLGMLQQLGAAPQLGAR